MDDILGRIKYQIERNNTMLEGQEHTRGVETLRDLELRKEMKIVWDVMQDLAMRMKPDGATTTDRLKRVNALMEKYRFRAREHRDMEWEIELHHDLMMLAGHPAQALPPVILNTPGGIRQMTKEEAEYYGRLCYPQEEITSRARAGAKALFEADISGDWRTAEGLEQMAAILAKAWEVRP